MIHLGFKKIIGQLETKKSKDIKQKRNYQLLKDFVELDSMFPILFEMILCININEISHETICCLNTGKNQSINLFNSIILISVSIIDSHSHVLLLS